MRRNARTAFRIMKRVLPKGTAEFCVLAVCAVTAGILPPAFASTGQQISGEVVFQGRVEGYHTYRIPAAVATESGMLLAFCEGRKTGSGDAGDIDLLLRRSHDNGDTWSPHAIVHEEGGDAPITIGNPCPVVDRHTGVVWLAFCRNNERAFVTSSQDDGLTWAEPEEMTAQLKAFPFGWTRLGTGPVNGLQLENGALVLPVWLNDRKGGDYRSAVMLSGDHGKTWRAGGIVPPALPGCNECTVAELANGQLYMNIRNNGPENRRGTASSGDGGMTWSAGRLERQLVGPVCQAAVLRADDAATLLFSNPASTRRENLTVRISRDAANTWSPGAVVWPGPAAYSCLVPLKDGRYGCLFEAGEASPYESIRFARFSLEQLDKADN